MKRTYHHVPYTSNQWRQAAKEGKQPTASGKPLPQGIVLGCQGGRKTTALVDLDDVHVLMIGASGVGKTAYFLYPQSGIRLCQRHELSGAGHQACNKYVDTNNVLKTECIYCHKPKSIQEANELIDRYIYFYNHERIQTKTGVAPLSLRHSA